MDRLRLLAVLAATNASCSSPESDAPGPGPKFFVDHVEQAETRSLSHARSKEKLEEPLELVRCYYNFARPHGALKFGREIRTPAMQAGLATRRVTLREIFVCARTSVSILIAYDVIAFGGTRTQATATSIQMPLAA